MSQVDPVEPRVQGNPCIPSHHHLHKSVTSFDISTMHRNPNPSVQSFQLPKIASLKEHIGKPYLSPSVKFGRRAYLLFGIQINYFSQSLCGFNSRYHKCRKRSDKVQDTSTSTFGPAETTSKQAEGSP